jgi:hypothetical protein
MTDPLTPTSSGQQRSLTLGSGEGLGSTAYYDKSWALSIGINDYGGQHPRLSNAVNDARAIAGILKEGYAFEHVFTLYNQAASRDEILGWLRDKLSGHAGPDRQSPTAQVGPNDRVVLFFAGHGTTQHSTAGNIRGYIIPQDARRGHYGDYIDMAELREACGYIPAKHVLIILDCCFSGVAAIGSKAVPSPPPMVLTDAYLQRITRRKAWQMLAAGDQDDLAADSGMRPGHSAFTGVLLDGLEGRADQNEDRVITASELAYYVTPEVTRQTARAGSDGQSPYFTHLAGSDTGDFVFVRKGETPVIQPAGMVEAEIKPFLKQYPRLALAIGVLLITTIVLGWLALGQRTNAVDPLPQLIATIRYLISEVAGNTPPANWEQTPAAPAAEVALTSTLTATPVALTLTTGAPMAVPEATASGTPTATPIPPTMTAAPLVPTVTPTSQLLPTLPGCGPPDYLLPAPRALEYNVQAFFWEWGHTELPVDGMDWYFDLKLFSNQVADSPYDIIPVNPTDPRMRYTEGLWTFGAPPDFPCGSYWAVQIACRINGSFAKHISPESNRLPTGIDCN